VFESKEWKGEREREREKGRKEGRGEMDVVTQEAEQV
jgi:hypothetical protein